MGSLRTTNICYKLLILNAITSCHLAAELPIPVVASCSKSTGFPDKNNNVFNFLRTKARTIPPDTRSTFPAPCRATSQYAAGHGGGSGGPQRIADCHRAHRHGQNNPALLPAAHPVPRGDAGASAALGLCGESNAHGG